MSSLRAKIWYEDCEVPFNLVTGQLMGNLLCFPLLCLQNYVAFRWVFPASVPVRINGDDIVFRATREGWEEWSRFVPRVGLILSKGKTLVSSSFFSINSSFFRVTRGRLKLIPVLRTGGLARPVDSVDGLGGSFRRYLQGFKGLARDRAELLFLLRKKPLILVSGRSVLRGLGIPASIPGIFSAGLWERECWFFDSLESEPRLPPAPRKLDFGRVPQGWVRVPLASGSSGGARARRAAQREVEKSFFSSLVAECWLTRPSKSDSMKTYWDSLRGTGHETAWRSWRSRRKCWKDLCRGLHPFRGLGSRELVKVPVEGPPSLRHDGLSYPWIHRSFVTAVRTKSVSRASLWLEPTTKVSVVASGGERRWAVNGRKVREWLEAGHSRERLCWAPAPDGSERLRVSRVRFVTATD
jgi:hypothetical protein